MSRPPLDDRTEHLLRELAPQVLGVVVRRFRDFAASEDAVQEALIAAAAQWPSEGLPANPRGWLIRVAFRRMTDQIRSEVARRAREAIVAEETPRVTNPAVDTTAADAGAAAANAAAEDDTLVLLFLCCHPSLSSPAAIALTLRAVGGLTTAEIAKAFLVPEPTMGQRISRAKQTIQKSGVRFEVPDARERGLRLSSVLRVLYLIFNEGYATSSGPSLERADLSSEAIRLTRAVHQLLPDDGEVQGLLALMLLTDARRSARSGPRGELVPLDEQDRTRWDPRAIEEGVGLVSAALRNGSVGEYQLLAAVAAVHDEAPRVEDTDWPQILALYSVLERMSDNPMVTLNRAVAAAEVYGPKTGLELLEPLDRDPRLRGNHRLDAVRAHLLERAGESAAAVVLYRVAAAKTANTPERDHLLLRAARLAQDAGAASGR